MTTPDGFAHHTARTTAGRIHYVRGGTGPLLLLLHGWTQTWFEWRRVMPALAEHYTVVAADWRGAGARRRGCRERRRGRMIDAWVT